MIEKTSNAGIAYLKCLKVAKEIFDGYKIEFDIWLKWFNKNYESQYSTITVDFLNKHLLVLEKEPKIKELYEKWTPNMRRVG